MAAPRQRRSWSGWNECGRDDLAVRQLPRRIANVLSSDGPRMTVGLRDDSGPGATIELFEEGTAPFGQAKK